MGRRIGALPQTPGYLRARERGAWGLVACDGGAYKARHEPDIRDHYSNYFPGALIPRDAGP
jgi:hypothetical protein